MRTLAEQRPLRADGAPSKYEHPPLLVAPWQAAMPGGAHINAAAMKENDSDVDEEYVKKKKPAAEKKALGEKKPSAAKRKRAETEEPPTGCSVKRVRWLADLLLQSGCTLRPPCISTYVSLWMTLLPPSLYWRQQLSGTAGLVNMSMCVPLCAWCHAAFTWLCSAPCRPGWATWGCGRWAP